MEELWDVLLRSIVGTGDFKKEWDILDSNQ